ncbi:efflux RND transporter periplasmic adaptor subunit [candidate division CSSED10-310 bacterium]|uniref:Efflux RND transporter periplasmic adaptor subunit n=1 Tax=candidate division CSSED10-310 bacterium TaxID=2855610 RepID=A0ABV6YRA0_UNCC1
MKSNRSKITVFVLMFGLASGLGWVIYSRYLESSSPGDPGAGLGPVPVEVAQIKRGPIEFRRIFSGSLESPAEFVVSPKVGGRVERLHVNLSDTVKRDQVVAELDNQEYVQAVALAEADLAVARANLGEARSALEIAAREFNRIKTLRTRGVASESQFDTAQADQLSKQARLEVSKAQLTRAEASLATARIRQGYTRVTAGWRGGDDTRVVAERYVNEGVTVSANARLLSIVELDPIIGVIFVTEVDYARLQVGQPATLKTDAYPDEEFSGQIARISPVFHQPTRQARVELSIKNPHQRLKPGMFIRVTVVLAHIDQATIVPELALTRRDDQTGIFVVNEDGQTVTWRRVTVGIRAGKQVQLEEKELSGLVLTLGQQLVDDGSKIIIPAEPNLTSLPR